MFKIFNKMRFNPDPKKQAQEMIFSRKLTKLMIPRYILKLSQIIFN